MSGAAIAQAIKEEVHKVIVGQDALIDRLLIALISDGHVLLEGVPGLAKTRTLRALTRSIDCLMHRVQFTPDVLPSDLIGTEVYRPQNGEFVIRRGPVFTNLLLADEINRAPAKVQSALLQAMEERLVTIGEETFQLPYPFLVLATQNPIEQEGTYPLPEAQLDRFLMKIKVSYPSFQDELTIVAHAGTQGFDDSQIRKVCSIGDLKTLKKEAEEIFIDPKIDRYVVSLVHATRDSAIVGLKGMIEWGASPRGSIALKVCARALALLKGKKFVTPDDVRDIAPDVLRHRILLSFEAEARGITPESAIETVLKNVPVP